MVTRIIPPPPPSWESWEACMLLALQEARQGALLGEIPVGALVISPQGNILGRGHNKCLTENDPTGHAEIVALRQAAKTVKNYRLTGCYLVVTLEPCLMCTGAIAHARLGGLVYGAYDLKSGAVDTCLDGLELPLHNTSVWHMGGILEDECAALLNNFFAPKR